MVWLEVLSFRAQKELKKIKELYINWSEELRRFLEDKVREYKKRKTLEEIDHMLKNFPPPRKGVASKYLREDRDSN